MLNFLYCLDSNYNLQAQNSIISLLDQIEEKISVYIIHENPETFNKVKYEIEKHPNLQTICIYKFQPDLIKDFPRVENTHISDATYYRLFIDRYLPSNIEFITYLDADIICVKSPKDSILEHIRKLDSSNFIISVKTETIVEDELAEINIRLESQTGKYFNAGVKIIDFKKWISEDISSKLLEELLRIKDKIYFWDQDVLNSFFDGDYIELNKYLNYNLHLTGKDYKDNTSDEDKEGMIFIHYAGSFKPWSIRGIYNPKSRYYQQQHMDINNKYHVINTWRVDAIKRFLLGIITLRIIFVRQPLRFFIDVFNSLLKSSKK